MGAFSVKDRGVVHDAKLWPTHDRFDHVIQRAVAGRDRDRGDWASNHRPLAARRWTGDHICWLDRAVRLARRRRIQLDRTEGARRALVQRAQHDGYAVGAISPRSRRCSPRVAAIRCPMTGAMPSPRRRARTL